MSTNKFFIEIRDDTTAIITSVDKTGVKKTKTIGLEMLSNVLNLKENNFNTGILPTNIVNIYQSGQYRTYHIFVPAHITTVRHTRFGEGPLKIKYPSMIFSFIHDLSATKRSTKRSLIRVLDTEEFDTKTPLYRLNFNNYSDGYGICWGNNDSLVQQILASGDDFRIATLPKLFLDSVFNNDLEYNYSFKEEVFEKIKEVTGFSSENSFNLFRYMGETEETYWMSSMIRDSYSDQSVEAYITSYNASVR